MTTTQTTTIDKQSFISVSEAADILRMQRKTVYAAISRGEIPAVKVGRRYLIPQSWLRKLLGESA